MNIRITSPDETFIESNVRPTRKKKSRGERPATRGLAGMRGCNKQHKKKQKLVGRLLAALRLRIASPPVENNLLCGSVERFYFYSFFGRSVRRIPGVSSDVE